MRKKLLFLSACFSLSFSFAQSLSPQVISSAGTSFINGASQLDWTLGETVTSVLSNSGGILSQGFHQPNLLVTAIDNVTTNYSITIFPNPTVDFLQIQIQNLLNEVIIVDLYNVQGKLLQTQQINSTADLKINLGDYSAGTYTLSLKDHSEKNKSYQIIKSN